MNQLNEQQVQLHVTIVGWLLILGNAIFLILAGFLFLLLTGIGAATRDPEAAPILFMVGTGIGVFFGVLAVPGLVAGFGLLARKTWGRILAVVIAILGLLNFPLGTLIGLYAIWVLLQESAGSYFQPNLQHGIAPKPAI